MSTLGDTKSTPGVYHDECGRYHKFSWGVQYTVEFHKYTGGILRCTWVVIMSTPGGVQYTGGYHEYTRRF